MDKSVVCETALEVCNLCHLVSRNAKICVKCVGTMKKKVARRSGTYNRTH